MTVVSTQRRAFRFTIRTLLVLIAGLAVVLAVYVNSANRQRRAVARIEQLRGGVQYDYNFHRPRAALPGPTWLRERLGIDYFATVNSVFFGRRDIGDDHLVVLRDLPQLRELSLHKTNVRGPGFVHVRNLPELRELHLWYTNVQDAGFVHVRDLSNLTMIVLAHCKATDETLENLCHLTQLQVLIINNTLKAPKEGAITDAGLVHLAGLKNLTRLELNASNVTDAGVVHLAGLSKLTYLSLVGTEMTDDGIVELKGKLPACRIYTGPPPQRKPKKP